MSEREGGGSLKNCAQFVFKHLTCCPMFSNFLTLHKLRGLVANPSRDFYGNILDRFPAFLPDGNKASVCVCVRCSLVNLLKRCTSTRKCEADPAAFINTTESVRKRRPGPNHESSTCWMRECSCAGTNPGATKNSGYIEQNWKSAL